MSERSTTLAQWQLRPATAEEEEPLGRAVLAHLAAQLGSAERMLAIVLDQGAAIRRRDVHAVVHCAGLLQGELVRRSELEERRGELLERAGAALGIAPEQITVGAISTLMGEQEAAQAAARSSQLRGILEQLQREHLINRALMRIELAFLDHLLGSLEPDCAPAYDRRGSAPAQQSARRSDLHVLDLEA
ncbi:MAG TPA: flagellar export chaperone FlgN [Solirubrobacteraceae bacterium]|nr:flagellar export chaperone FlgN [Solirubrobacteraceae bacterium]